VHVAFANIELYSGLERYHDLGSTHYRGSNGIAVYVGLDRELRLISVYGYDGLFT
jgi:hypothetical protein